MRYFSIPVPVRIFCVFILLNGCEKETIVEKEVEKVHAWKPVSVFSYNNRMQLNSFGDSAFLFTVNPSYFNVAWKNEDSKPLNTLPYVFHMEPSIHIRYPICTKYFVVTDHSLLRIGVPAEPLGYSANVSFWMKEIDPMFDSYNLPLRFFGDGIGINKNNSLLVIYRHYDSTNSGTSALLVHLSFQQYGAHVALDTSSTKIIRLNNSYFTSTSVYHFFNHYFVGSSKTYRTSDNGTATVCFSRDIYNMFQIGSYLYGISWGTVVRSTDQGVSWNEIGKISSSFEILSYIQAEGSIIAFRNSQLFRITLNDSVDTIEELENDGLDGHEITSISCYRNEMYVTTFSGVFSKPAQEFFNMRESTLKKQSFFIN